MSASSAAVPGTLGATADAALSGALGATGIWLDIGAVTLHVRSDSATFARQLRRTYGHFPLQTSGDWADVHVRIQRPQGLKRWLRRQVVLQCDGRLAYDAFPADSPLPLFEWGCNGLIAQRCNDLLLLHAGALERDGLALLLPALPGSGKSTLTAALASRGWRLLSDEFGAFDPQRRDFRAILKPVALKNASIDVIRRFAPQAIIGPSFPKTRKGTVAHVAPAAHAVTRRNETAAPGAVVLPRWVAGSATKWESVEPQVLFPSLAFNAFNYGVLGAVGFESVLHLVKQCPAWQLIYSDLDDALRVIDSAWAGIVRRQREMAA